MKGIRRVKFLSNRITSSFREYPDFIILGNSFCAKTLLYNYLTEHKLILKNLLEETAFFVDYYEKGTGWYKANFPSKIEKETIKKKYGRNPLVGETINLPYREIPERVHKLIPNPKIIVILRNPIERAFASYFSLVEKGIENLSFEEAILKKIDRWENINQKLTENKIEELDEKISTYLTNSIYIDDIKNWNKFFPKEKMLFLKSEDLFQNPLKIINITLNFLELKPINQIKKNAEKKKNIIKIESHTMEKLKKLFKPHNKRLYEYIGRDLGWD